MPTPRARSRCNAENSRADLVGRQARGRFVEHQDLRLGRERAGDRDQRLLGAAQILDAHVGIDVGAERVKRGRRAAARRVQSMMPRRRG